MFINETRCRIKDVQWTEEMAIIQVILKNGDVCVATMPRERAKLLGIREDMDVDLNISPSDIRIDSEIEYHPSLVDIPNIRIYQKFHDREGNLWHASIDSNIPNIDYIFQRLRETCVARHITGDELKTALEDIENRKECAIVNDKTNQGLTYSQFISNDFIAIPGQSQINVYLERLAVPEPYMVSFNLDNIQFYSEEKPHTRPPGNSTIPGTAHRLNVRFVGNVHSKVEYSAFDGTIDIVVAIILINDNNVVRFSEKGISSGCANIYSRAERDWCIWVKTNRNSYRSTTYSIKCDGIQVHKSTAVP